MDRFAKALVFAAELHGEQYRKASSTPYIAHLLGVTALVLENGGDQDQAIAALLHDSAEDQGGRATLHEIERRFGSRVSDLVRAMSDTLENPKPAWRERKEAYLRRLADAGSRELLIAVADKVHNARAIVRDLRLSGSATWKKFTGGEEGSLWYYAALVRIFRRNYPGYLTEELALLVYAMHNPPPPLPEENQDVRSDEGN